MKQIVSNYSYSPTANCVTLTGLNIDQDQLLLVVAPGVGRTLYNFASVTGSVVPGANTRINLTASTAGLTTTSPLVIFYDDQSATQTIAGTVTANIGSQYFSGQSGVTYSLSLQSWTDGGEIFPVALDEPLPVKIISGTVTIGNSITIGSLPAISGTVTVGNPITISSIPAVMLLGSNGDRIDDGAQIPISGNVDVNSLPPISGTVTVGNQPNLISFVDSQRGTVSAAPVYFANGAQSGVGWATLEGIFIHLSENGEGVPISLPSGVTGIGVTVTNSVTIGSLPAISGTVTANLSSVPTHGVTIANTSVTVNGTFYQATQPVSLASLPSLAAGTAQIGSVTASISGTVPVSGTFYQATQPVSIASLPASTVTVSSIPAISGTVTANVASTTVTVSVLPSGALTTRFGSVTTANTAQITSAVTNNSRKYLLAQNISAGTVTIGIGFSPTTTQGIQLTAGAGLTFDAFCPTGAVYWLGATTGATWTILEG